MTNPEPTQQAPLLGPLSTIRISLKTLFLVGSVIAGISYSYFQFTSLLDDHTVKLNRITVHLEQLKARINNLERQLQRLTPRGQGWHDRDKILTYGVSPPPYNSLNRTETIAEWHTCLRVVVTQHKVIHPNCMYVLDTNRRYWLS